MIGYNGYMLERLKQSYRVLSWCLNCTDRWIDSETEFPKDDLQAIVTRSAMYDSINFIYGYVAFISKEFCILNKYEVRTILNSPGTLDYIRTLSDYGYFSLEENHFMFNLIKSRNSYVHKVNVSREFYARQFNETLSILQEADLSLMIKKLIRLYKDCSKIMESIELEKTKDLVYTAPKRVFTSGVWRSED